MSESRRFYDRDHCIGHAYFTHLWSKTDGPDRFDALADTFRNRVLPLLEEYFFEDWRKIRRETLKTS